MAQTAAQPAPGEVSAEAKKKVVYAMTAVFATYFVYYFATNTQNVAAPRMAADLNGMALYSWGIAIPAMASALATLVFSKLADIYGRRVILAISLILAIGGSALAAVAQTFPILIVARFIFSFGLGAIAPLCFGVIGSMFNPVDRSRWSGLLAIPAGIATVVGPTLGGVITDSSLTWRFLFWLAVIIGAIAFALLLWGLPKDPAKGNGKTNIDYIGILLLTIAASTMIVGFSWAGSTYAWTSIQVIAMLGFSIIMWALFLRQEGKTAEPILDPEVLTNRTFLTAAVAGFLSFFGLLGIMMYFTLFLQGVQGISATLSGTIITPFGAIMAFMGVPAGILLAKTKKYKWMYIAGYALLTVMMFVMWKFNVATPIWVSVLVTALAGLGLGAIPTVNTLVVQFALPKRLMGIAIGAIYFFVMMGFAIAPAILGSFMNASYASSLQQNLPAALAEKADPAMMQSLLNNSRVLLTPDAMTSLQTTLAEYGDAALFDQTVAAIRTALEYSLQMVFLLGAITMLAAFILIITIPEVSLDIEVQDKKAPAAK